MSKLTCVPGCGATPVQKIVSMPCPICANNQ